MKLNRSFFQRNTLTVAKELLGKCLVFHNYHSIIYETEAYIGQDDPACHAARGRTKRTEVMFGEAGHAYVYLIYGIYHCLNIITESQDFPAGVLIRGIYTKDPFYKLDGPGKLCRHLGINLSNNNTDIIVSSDFFIEDIGLSMQYTNTPRIGIVKGREKLWRFLGEPTTP